ncbi:MAG: TetR/AcrR family transcriptional regulator [Polyangiaceae bacterium]|nr:TetR/AcrR family transcriptional regulator [Polyangiaceae bacterium]
MIAVHQRREQRHSERAEQIAARALEIVAEEGIDALTLGRLARDLHVVPAALYRYFPSKDALVADLQRRTLAQVHARFAEVLGALGAGDPLARLWACGQLYLELPQTNPQGFRLIAQLLADPRPLVPAEEASVTAEAVAAFLGEVGQLILQASAAGKLAPGSTSDRALSLWALLQGVAQLGKLSRFDERRFDPQRLGSSALGDLLLGWGAPPKAVAELRASAASDAAPPKTSSAKRASNKKRKVAP